MRIPAICEISGARLICRLLMFMFCTLEVTVHQVTKQYLAYRRKFLCSLCSIINMQTLRHLFICLQQIVIFQVLQSNQPKKGGALKEISAMTYRLYRAYGHI